MSHQGKSTSELRLQALSDRLRNTLSYDEEDNGVNVNKPDFRELDLGSPVSPLRHRACRVSASTATTPSSSSSSSGSVSGRSTAGVHSNPPRKSNSNSHSGELSSCSVGSSPSAVRNSNPGNTRTASGGTHQLIYSSGGSVNSPAVNVLPNGNICPSGRVLKTGMASRPTKTDVLGSGTGNYGHGSIMRGGPSSKPSVTKDSRPINYSRGLIVGGESVKRTGTYNNDDAEELKKRGNENYRKGNFAEALAFYSKAIAVSPSNAAYHFNRAATLIGLRRLAEAVRECEEAIKLDPGYVRAHHRLGSLLLSLGQVENARKHLCYPGYQADAVELQKLQAVEKHLNKCTDARRVGDWRNTLSEVDAAIASGADASPQLCACRAEALLKLLQLDDAFLAISDIPKFELSTGKIFGMLFEAYIFFVRAQIELARGRFENALTDVEKARKVDPRNVEISVMLNNVRLVGRARARGNDLFKSERFTEACSAYGEGLRLDPFNSVLYCNRAACWFKLGQWQLSVDDCNQALCFQPNYIKALLRRAASNCKLERWDEAVRDYELLRRELPNDNEIAESLFHAQVAQKKSCGEEVYNLKFGGEVESVSGLEQFQAATSSPSVSVVHFKAVSNLQCKRISPFLDTLCTRYPSINFLKVDIEESPAVARAENVRIVPTFKIYRKGSRVKEMICPSPEVLEASVRHYSF
ncbi:TPR repeat-containing thioredoxin TTL1-like [Olea europaea var. sylvestris]|uniref:TPR repeat-containing thioredoxin TTL1-like n=2 Tax=Olea europaea subsp. europaea TaxID=158383 RepID=A0A8S0R673_OLEEU|nr:TPR repeat-containing thioredoxin TTL1-like [Olea europaea var. sylvestris]CAA2973819.1 TPR repeat-containing thioredoxin TTL1-like [Olea europaea subsp. europaea]